MHKTDKQSLKRPAPLVSVICRSINRKELQQALASIAAQSHSPIEVVLVDATGKGLTFDKNISARLDLKNISTGKPMRRSEAANAGLQNSTGDYLIFLDDDDYFGPDHIKQLLEFLSGFKSVRAVYSSTRKVSKDGVELDEVFASQYDPVLLRRDNYIPIHSMLFKKALLQDGCRFDEALDIYEDWDFWLQLAQHTKFAHLDKISAFYRQGGDSDTAIADDDLRFRSGHPIATAREAIYDKWLYKWSGADLNELIGSLQNTKLIKSLQVTADNLHTRLVDENKQNQEKQHQIDNLHSRLVEENNQKNEQIDSLHSRLVEEARKSVELGHLHKILEEKELRNSVIIRSLHDEKNHLEQLVVNERRQHKLSSWHLKQHIHDLQSQLDEIFASYTWRALGPLRRTRRSLQRVILLPLKKRIHYWRYGTELLSSVTVPHFPLFPPEVSNPSVKIANDHPQNLKDKYKAEANRNLQAFLHGKSVISFPETESPKVSILLVLFNQASLTLLCLESILKFAPDPYELVIVDNASSDDSSRLLGKLRNAKTVRNSDNLGFVKAVNQGSDLCRGEYILLLNNDAMLHENAIGSALATFSGNKDVGAVGGRILLLDGTLQEAGSFIFSDGSCLGYGRHGNPEDPAYMFQRPVDYCSGAFLLFRNDLFREMGGFDLDYAPAYYEDSDFCIRLQKRGLKIIYDPLVVITHYEFASSGSQDKATELQRRHRNILCDKHPDYLATRPAPALDNLLAARTANQHPNILLIDDRVPHANLGSGYPRCKKIVTLLSESDFNLTFYPLQFPNESWSSTYQTLPSNVEVILHSGNVGLPTFLALRKDFYDYILISRIHNMRSFCKVVESDPSLVSHANIIYDAEAVTAHRDIMYRELKGESVAAEEINRLVLDEIGAATLADRVITVSQQEADIYQLHGYKNTTVLGHSLTCNPTKNSFSERKHILFVGALRDENSPNVDSLHWFAEKILPELNKLDPTIMLIAVGDNSAPSLTALKSAQIQFTGQLDDIDSFYNSCRIFIAPTRFAAGIPHKVHEAAAFGLPSIVTPLLAQQLRWLNEKELLVAETAAEFARQCFRLYQDQELWELIRLNGIAAIERDCSSENFSKQLLRLFDK